MSVRVEWYEIGLYSRPHLRVEGQHWNPDADAEEFEQDGVTPADPDDEVPTEVALVFSGGEVGVLAGHAADLRSWLAHADRALAAYENAQAEKLGAQPCRERGEAGTFTVRGDGVHEWQLVEDDYQRTWSTKVTFDEAGEVTGVAATSDGSSSFSDDGSGEYLQCVYCLAHLAIPDGVYVDYD